MENRAEEFLSQFDDCLYPKEFASAYEAMECLGSGDRHETLLVREKATGRLLVAKCYERGHPLFFFIEPTGLRELRHRGLPAFVGGLLGEDMRCSLWEYVPGETLWQIGKKRSFDPETVRRAGIEICGILEYLHSQRPPVIHRDIKPQNVVIREDGSLSLIDLGISRQYVAGARSDTVFFGTQDFAPPEQYGFLQTDSRSDIYSLGILLAWMLTGKAARPESASTPLGGVIAVATAFSPEGRFRDASAMKRALLGIGPGKKSRMRAVLGAVCALAILSVVMWATFWRAPTSLFREPLIEEAVRLVLGKEPGERISPEELATVEGIYVTHGTVCGDIEGFFRTHEKLCGEDFDARGPIVSLEDLALLPNLRVLCVAAQQITDISPLRPLEHLFQVELRFNSVSDISPLSGMADLVLVGLNSNPVTDISPLATLGDLRSLDLCDANDYQGEALGLLGDLDFLDISNHTDSFMHLGGKAIGELKISRTKVSDLSCLREVTGLRRLDAQGTKIVDLSELGNHPDLTFLRLTGIPATDYSPLLWLPNLGTVVIGAGAMEYIGPISSQGGFQVILEP